MTSLEIVWPSADCARMTAIHNLRSAIILASGAKISLMAADAYLSAIRLTDELSAI